MSGNGAVGTERKALMENTAMQFVLRGFSQSVGLRIYAFEGVAADRTRALFTVSADISMTVRYGIRLQDLPLLCRAVLERSHEGGTQRAFSYSEDEMRVYASSAAARDEAAKQRKPPRRHPPENAGANWRVPPR
jgi:hypothetical protein